MFPQVPNVPGVPVLARNATNSIFPALNLLTADDPALASFSPGPQWGLFDSSNSPVINPDSFLGIDQFKAEAVISDYQVEGGASASGPPIGFQSFNKVEKPRSIRAVFAKGGTVSDRTQFLTDCETAKQSLDTYTLVMPEISYSDMNVTDYDYRRTSEKGATLLTVSLLLEEIRATAVATFSNTQQPQGQDQTQTGGVQPQTPTATQSTAAAAQPVM